MYVCGGSFTLIGASLPPVSVCHIVTQNHEMAPPTATACVFLCVQHHFPGHITVILSNDGGK